MSNTSSKPLFFLHCFSALKSHVQHFLQASVFSAPFCLRSNPISNTSFKPLFFLHFFSAFKSHVQHLLQASVFSALFLCVQIHVQHLLKPLFFLHFFYFFSAFNSHVLPSFLPSFLSPFPPSLRFPLRACTMCVRRSTSSS